MKKSADTVESLVAEIRNSFRDWEQIRKSGCNDPFYPDGVNMNLVRNHIIYFQERLVEICKSQKVKAPREARLKLPPEVMETFQSKGRKKRA